MDERTERLREVSRRAADAVRGLSILDQYAVLRMVGSAVRSHGISDRGLSPDAFALVDDEIAALEAGLAWARPGDVVLVLVHVQRVAVRAWLAAHARPAG